MNTDTQITENTQTTKLTPLEFVARYPAIDVEQLIGFLCYNIKKLGTYEAVSFRCNLDTYSIVIDEKRFFKCLLYFPGQYI